MKSVSLINIGYKRVLKEAQEMFPGYTEQVALIGFISVQDTVLCTTSEIEYVIRYKAALINKEWAKELLSIYTLRTN